MKPSHCTTLLASGLLLLSACGHGSASKPEVTESADGRAAAAAKGGEAGKEDADEKSSGALTLTDEQRKKIGIETTPVKESTFLAEAGGYGVVLGHEAIAVASAEVATAQAAVRQSRAALARSQKLADTPGALPAETAENTERQAAADATALTLAERRLTALLGQAPALDAGGALLAELSTGQVKLVRATFPLGILTTAAPRRLRLARLDATAGARNWTSTTIWPAPADNTIPGRSFFTLLRDSDLGEGERVQVWAAMGATVRGVIVPASAVVQSNSAYWCFVEEPAGTFTRAAVDIGRPTEGGYFVADGVDAGDAVVTSGAGLLLARQINPSTEAEE
jgi:hypothetical protein